MTDHWADDARLLADLAEAMRSADAVPPFLLRAGQQAWDWRTADAELAVLTFDSAVAADALAATRGPDDSGRWLTFTVGDVTVELEWAPDAVRGRIVPGAAGQVSLFVGDGSPTTGEVDDYGYFVLRPAPVVAFRLVGQTAEHRFRTDWVAPSNGA